MVSSMPHARSRDLRSGVSLVEVLTVIGILSLLVALFLPAVQASRESARQAHCKSNLNQIMLAQHQYLGIHGVFPTLEGHFHYRIAGMIESPNPDQYTTSSVYTCPTDAEALGFVRTGALSSYLGSIGLKRDGYRGIGDGFSGGYLPNTFHGETYLSDSHMKDGLSNTAAVGECLAIPSFYTYDVDWDDYPQFWNRLLRLTDTRYNDLTAMADDCQFNAGRPRVRQYPTTFYNHILPPNQHTCTNGRPFDPYLDYPVTSSSLHRGGVNLAMADGSVRFVSETISRDVWWAIGTRSGGETIGLDE